MTGFGLVGHLVEMARASSVKVNLDLDAVPVLPGALECIRAGVFSSLHADNLRAKRAVSNHSIAALHSKYALMFDPQTAGGLLAGVPESEVEATLAALVAAGYEASTVIGTVLGDYLPGEQFFEPLVCSWATN